METKFICGTMSDRGVAVYVPIGNMFYHRAVAGFSLERCQLSES